MIDDDDDDKEKLELVMNKLTTDDDVLWTVLFFEQKIRNNLNSTQINRYFIWYISY